MLYKHIENLQHYNKACKSLGVPLFDPCHLIGPPFPVRIDMQV